MQVAGQLLPTPWMVVWILKWFVGNLAIEQTVMRDSVVA